MHSDNEKAAYSNHFINCTNSLSFPERKNIPFKRSILTLINLEPITHNSVNINVILGDCITKNGP